jgi:hypothetical protein
LYVPPARPERPSERALPSRALPTQRRPSGLQVWGGPNAAPCLPAGRHSWCGEDISLKALLIFIHPWWPTGK